MKIFANGFPKSGNHALVKALQLLGQPCEVNHASAREGVPEGVTHHVLIVRDPRNIVVSWLRFNRQPVTPGTFLTAFRKFQERPLVEEMGEYEPWLKSARVVPYESLVQSDLEMKLLANWLGVPYLEGAWEQLPGHTMTWNDEKSDYRNVWTDHVNEVWDTEGGADLMRRWGY